MHDGIHARDWEGRCPDFVIFFLLSCLGLLTQGEIWTNSSKHVNMFDDLECKHVNIFLLIKTCILLLSLPLCDTKNNSLVIYINDKYYCHCYRGLQMLASLHLSMLCSVSSLSWQPSLVLYRSEPYYFYCATHSNYRWLL